MSVGAEILMRAIVDRMDGALFLSEFGDGSPLLDGAALPPVRMARRPVGGVCRRGTLATFAPPLDIAARRADCVRLAQRRLVIVDAIAADAADLVACADLLAKDAVAALRVRGARYAHPSLTLVYESHSGADQIYLRRDLITDEIAARASALAAAKIDEFDALSKMVGKGGVVTAIRHGAGQSEAMLDPASLLDQADARQIAAALGDGRAIMAKDGGCALFVPQLSGAPMPVAIVCGGLDAGALDPCVSISNAPGWTLETRHAGDAHHIVVRPTPDARPVVSLFLEIEAPDSPNAHVTEIASAITRARGAWEIWDEAQQQLELEESW